MSFMSDLFEGNFSNLGTDITHAPSSLANHPLEIGETAAAVATALSLGTLGPEAFGALGAADLGMGAADLGAADAAFGTFDSGLFAANAADAGLGLGGVDLASIGGGVADLGAANTAFGTFDPALFGENLADASGAGAFGVDMLGGSEFENALLSDNAMLATGPDPSPQFAQTDAELFGGQTGVAPTAAPSYVNPSVVNAPPSGEMGLANLNSSFGTFDAGTGGGGLTGQLGSVLNSPWTRLAAGAAPLALAMFRGEPSLPPAALQAQGNAAALSTFGQQQLAMGQAGQLNAGQMALIQKTQQDLTNAARQQFYNMGVQNPQADSRWVQTLANIDMEVTAMTAKMIQQEIDNGLKALGESSQTLNQIAQMQMNADQNFTNTLVNATKALGLAAGSGMVTKTTTTTQAAA